MPRQRTYFPSYPRGVINTQPAEQLPTEAVVEALNMELDRRRNLRTRPGVQRIDPHTNLLDTTSFNSGEWVDGGFSEAPFSGGTELTFNSPEVLAPDGTSTALRVRQDQTSPHANSWGVQTNAYDITFNPLNPILLPAAVTDALPGPLTFGFHIHMPDRPFHQYLNVLLRYAELDVGVSVINHGAVRFFVGRAANSSAPEILPNLSSLQYISSKIVALPEAGWYRVFVTLDVSAGAEFLDIFMSKGSGGAFDQIIRGLANEGGKTAFTQSTVLPVSDRITGLWDDLNGELYPDPRSDVHLWGMSIEQGEGGLEFDPTNTSEPTITLVGRVTSMYEYRDFDSNVVRYVTSGNTLYEWDEPNDRLVEVFQFGPSDTLPQWVTYDGEAYLAVPGDALMEGELWIISGVGTAPSRVSSPPFLLFESGDQIITEAGDILLGN